MASSIKNLNPADKIDFETTPDPKEFGFDKKIAAMEFSLKGENEPYTLVIGMPSQVGPNVYAYTGKQPKKVFLVPNYFAEMLKKDLFHWRNKRIFPKIESDAVTFIRWKGIRSMAAEKNADQWTLKEPISAPGNLIMLEGVASTVALAAAKAIYAEDDHLNKTLEKTPELTIEFGKGKEISKVLLFRKKGQAKTDKTLIAKVEGRPSYYEMDAVPFERFSKDLVEYRERKILREADREKFDEISFSFPRDKKQISLKREGQNWKYLAGEKPKEALSQQRIIGFMNSLFYTDATVFEAKGLKWAAFQKGPVDLELLLKSGGKEVKTLRFVLDGKSTVLTQGEIPQEVRIFAGEFLKTLPIRLTDLNESSNKQVVVPVQPPEGGDNDGHDHSSGH